MTKQASEGSTLALKPRGDITRSPKQGYQWPHEKDLCPPKLKKNLIARFSYISTLNYSILTTTIAAISYGNLWDEVSLLQINATTMGSLYLAKLECVYIQNYPWSDECPDFRPRLFIANNKLSQFITNSNILLNINKTISDSMNVRKSSRLAMNGLSTLHKHVTLLRFWLHKWLSIHCFAVVSTA